MTFKRHFISTTILSVALFPLIKYRILWVLISGIFIDIDHYLWYVIRYNDWNIKHAVKHFESDGNVDDPSIFIFHTMEFIVIIFILSLFYNEFFYILIGAVFHIIPDILLAKDKPSVPIRSSLIYFFYKGLHKKSEFLANWKSND